MKKGIPYDANLGVWTYVWFGYNWNKNIANGVIKFPNSDKATLFEDVRHMVPKYVVFFAGNDGYLKPFNGPI